MMKDLYSSDPENPEAAITPLRFGRSQLEEADPEICGRGIIEYVGIKYWLAMHINHLRNDQRSMAAIVKDMQQPPGDLAGLEKLAKKLEDADGIAGVLAELAEKVGAEPSVQALLEYAMEHDLDPAIRAFLATFPPRLYRHSQIQNPVRWALEEFRRCLGTLVDCGVDTKVFETEASMNLVICEGDYDTAETFLATLKTRCGSESLFQCVLNEPPESPEWREFAPPPVFIAVVGMNAYSLSALLEFGADPNVRFRGWTPLLLATAMRLPVIAAVLLDKGASIGDRMAYRDDIGLLHLIAHADHGIFKPPPRQYFLRAPSPLQTEMQCYRYGDDLLLELFKNAGSDPTELSSSGKTPLEIATETKNLWVAARLTDSKWETRPELYKELLLSRDVHGRGFLDYAIEDLELGLAESLVSLGANVNHVFPDGSNMLHESIRQCNPAGMQFCLSHGLSPTTPYTTPQGRTTSPLELAIATKNTKSCLLLLDASPTSITETNSQGRSIFHLAARTNPSDSQLLTLLLEKYRVLPSAPPLQNLFSARDNRGRTPLHYACQSDTRGFNLPTILALSTDINATDIMGDTPLHTAVDMNLPAAYQLLLSHHAHPNVANCFGLTPLHLAYWRQSEEKTELVDALVTVGADEGVVVADGLVPKEWGRRMRKVRGFRDEWLAGIEGELERRMRAKEEGKLVLETVMEEEDGDEDNAAHRDEGGWRFSRLVVSNPDEPEEGEEMDSGDNEGTPTSEVDDTSTSEGEDPADTRDYVRWKDGEGKKKPGILDLEA